MRGNCGEIQSKKNQNHEEIETSNQNKQASYIKVSEKETERPRTRKRTEGWNWRGSLEAGHYRALAPFRIAHELLRKVRRNVGDDQGIISFVPQLQHVTNSMNLGDQRAFIR